MSRETTSSAWLKKIVSNILNMSEVNDGPDCSEYEPPEFRVEFIQPRSNTCGTQTDNNENKYVWDDSVQLQSREESQTCSSTDESSSSGDSSSGDSESNAARTENGALSYCSTQDPRLDLFFKTVRNMSREYLELLLQKSWDASPRDTLRTIFYVRDCRGGKGERRIFWHSMFWLWRNHREYFEKNISCVPFYGSFKDLLQILQTGTTTSSENGWTLEKEFERCIISYWCDVLQKDVVSLNHNENITLAAKWIPIQDGRFCKEMGLSHKFFRKTVRLLREKLDIVECKMSSGEWDKILFERVCSLSMKKYSGAFRKHCEERFSSYLQSVAKGEKKMNVGQLYPSDIAAQFIQGSTSCDEETLNVAWEQLLTKSRQSMQSNPKRILCVVDTSGSMRGTPMNVAVGLGLFFSELYPESKFYRKFITFSGSPKLQTVSGNTLRSRVASIENADWGMNTNLQKVFDLVLESSTPDDHPDVIIILSDMQFDVSICAYQGWGSRIKDVTNFEEIENKYYAAGIKRPRLVFWNLRANTIDFPTTSLVPDCALISGYSTSLMDSILQDGEISPMRLYRNTIDSQRYDIVYTE